MLSFATVQLYLRNLYITSASFRRCLHGGGLALVGLALVQRAGFHLALTWEKPALLPGLAILAELPGLTTFISPRNLESDICILYPTHRQTKLVK